MHSMKQLNHLYVLNKISLQPMEQIIVVNLYCQRNDIRYESHLV